MTTIPQVTLPVDLEEHTHMTEGKVVAYPNNTHRITLYVVIEQRGNHTINTQHVRSFTFHAQVKSVEIRTT